MCADVLRSCAILILLTVSLPGGAFCRDPWPQEPSPPPRMGQQVVPKGAWIDPKLHEPPPPPQPVPRMQVIPLPDSQVSFQRDGVEVARYYFGPSLNRPFIFPVIGPSGRSLTRMGHPGAVEMYHSSVWVAHSDVNGVSFWNDGPEMGRIVHQRIERFVDGQDAASVLTENAWISNSGTAILTEHRLITVQALPNRELMLTIDMLLEPLEGNVIFGETPFGLMGLQTAKTIDVYDGGGTIRNSEGAVDEGNVIWRRAKWVDSSGPMTATANEGITLMDHPVNPNYPAFFHVRRTGMIECSLTTDAPRKVEQGKPLRLRYGLYVHNGIPPLQAIEERWEEFVRAPVPSLVVRRK